MFTGSTVFQQERDASIDILALNLDTEAQDMADGLTNAVTRDGQSPPTANLPMGGFQLTGLGAGTAGSSSITVTQVQTNAVVNCGTFGGTANALTASLSPAIAAYTARMRVLGTAAASVTGASTIVLNGIASPVSVRKKLASGLAPTTGGEWITGQTISFTYDGTYFVLDDKPEWQAGASIASAATIDLATSTGEYVEITGSTGPVTSLGTLPAGTLRVLRFASTPTLTYNATSLILPGAANITAAAGDVAWVVSEGAGNWRCTSYQKGDGTPVAGGGAAAANQSQVNTGTSSNTYVAPSTLIAASYLNTPNFVINPQGAIAQRSLSGVTDNNYGFDQWRLLMEGANAATLSQVTSSLPTTATTAMRLTVGSGNNLKFGLFQPIESQMAALLRSSLCCLQAQIITTAGISDVRMALVEWTSTADGTTADPVSAWNSAGTNPTLAANWAYVNTPANLSATTSYALYSITGTPSASANNLAVFIWNDDRTTTTTTDYLEFTLTCLAPGGAPIAFPARDPAVELEMCQRFTTVFAAAQTGDAFGSGFIQGATSTFVSFPLPTTMRASPTVSASAGSDFRIFWGSGNTACNAVGDQKSNRFMAYISAGTAGGLTTGQGCILESANTNARLTFSATI